MSKPLHILLVEDNEDDAELLLATLRHGGFDPVWERVQTAEELRRTLESKSWDILISDYSLPGFNAPSALKILRESKLDIPAIVISGTIGEEVAVETLKLGADDYLLKQNLTRLVPAVERTLVDAENRRERLAAEHINGLIMANSLDALCVMDSEGRIRKASAAAERVWGFRAEELANRIIFDLIHPGDRMTSIAQFQSVLAGIPSRDSECRMIRKDGSVIHIMWSGYWSEKDALFFAVARDVTARKQNEEALQRSEANLRKERALLRALIDSIPDLIFFKDKNSVFLGCNKAFEKRIGSPECDLIGRTDYDYFPHETAQGYRQKDIELLSSGRQQRTEELIPKTGGGNTFFETVKTPYFGPNGESLGLIGVSRDITERKLSEENLRLLLERLQLAAKAAQAGIWELDIAANQTTWDEQMHVLFGDQPTDASLEGIERWYRRMQAGDIDRCNRLLEEVQSQGRDSFDIEIPITRADDGRQRLIRSIGTVLRDSEGQATRIIGINRDVTEERNREKELASALAHEKELSEKARAGERAKSEFLAVMSHELRTPMNGILGFAELLSQYPALPEECQNYSQTIVQSGESLLRILDDILDFSRLEAGRLQIETKRFEPRRLVDEIRKLLARQAGDKGLKLEISVDENIPVYLEGDGGRIRQILVNLLGNALKFTDRGLVRLSLGPGLVSENGRSVFEFHVRDTGAGIAQEKLESIFQPFTQADSSISRRHGGTGLGLTISRRLTELLGGTLTAHSEPGKGSEFLARIPLGVPEQTAQYGKRVQISPLDARFAAEHPLRILLVEDDKINLKLIQTLIRRLGYAPLAAQNGREAVSIYQSEQPDCVLMDLQMPEMDGIEATEHIRTLEQRLRRDGWTFISALTANIFPADRQRCLSCGMNSYLNKPVKISALAEMLAQASIHCRQHSRLK